MKLNKREKYLIALFLIGIAIIGFYKYHYAPSKEQINKLKDRIAEVENAVAINEIQASSENNIYQELEGIKGKIQDMTSRFYPRIIQEKYILQIDDFIKQTGIEVYSISFTEPEKAFIEKAKEEEEEKSLLEDYVDIYKGISQQMTLQGANKSNTEKKTSDEEETTSQEEDLKDKVEKLTVSMNFSADYDTIKAFMNLFHQLNKNVLIENLSMTHVAGQKLICSMTIDYYALPQIETSDSEYLEWQIEDEYGLDNPFIAFEGAKESKPEIIEKMRKPKRVKERQDDFQIGVYPSSADIPSVIIGDARTDDGRTYVYGDNEGYELVEFIITKSEGRYYYKYRTESESYPTNYDTIGNLFYPTDDQIYLTITSSKRKNNQDTNGIRLSIVNKSDLELVMTIKGDDTNRPRIKVKDMIGKVVME